MTAVQMALAEAELSYARRGWRVFPLHGIRPDGRCTCGRNCGKNAGKHPRIGDWDENATTDETQIKRWRRKWPDSNIGIATGATSGIVALDPDGEGGADSLAALERENEPLPDAPTSLTGGGGQHLLFAHPGPGLHLGNRANIAPDLDARGDGGYIVAPPSVHASGRRYEWDVERHPDSLAPPEMPGWLRAHMTRPVAEPTVRSPDEGPPADLTPILTACSWLRHCVSDAKILSEPEWYGMLTIVGRCQDGARFAHEFSKPHPGYDAAATGEKLAHALNDTGPFSCAQVESHLGGASYCANCLFRGKVKSPIAIARSKEAALDPPPEWASGDAAFVGDGLEESAEPIEAPAAVPGNGTEPEGDEPAPVPEDEGAGANQFVLAADWAAAVHERLAWFEGAQWWSYAGGVWSYSSAEVAEASVQRFITRRLPASKITPHLVRSVMFLARSMLGPHDVAELNARPTWVPVANGVYDTEADRLIPHSPDHFLTHRLSFAYDPRADCPRWLEFLGEVIHDREGEPCAEWIATIQEWFGYCLVPDNSAQAAMFWVGSGRNGKGVATRVLEALLGPAQCTAVAIEQLHEPYHRAELQGKLVGFVNEPDARAMLKNASHFKALTGGDPISARRPTEKVFSFTPSCRLVVSTNTLPSSRDESFGYYRRVLIIEWRKEIERAKIDPALSDKLIAELPGILNWSLKGLRGFRARGSRFAEIEESERLLADYRLEEDPMGQYFADELEDCEHSRPRCSAVYLGFSAYCKANGFRDPPSATRINRWLERKGYKRVHSGQRSGRVWCGFRFKPGSPFAPPPDEQMEMPS